MAGWLLMMEFRGRISTCLLSPVFHQLTGKEAASGVILMLLPTQGVLCSICWPFLHACLHENIPLLEKQSNQLFWRIPWGKSLDLAADDWGRIWGDSGLRETDPCAFPWLLSVAPLLQWSSICDPHNLHHKLWARLHFRHHFDKERLYPTRQCNSWTIIMLGHVLMFYPGGDRG